MTDLHKSASEQREHAGAALERAMAGAASLVQEMGGNEASQKTASMLVQDMVTAVVGYVNAISFQVAAEHSDRQRLGDLPEEMAAHRRRIMERGNAVRNAIARGDFAAAERLLDPNGGAAPPEEAGAEVAAGSGEG